MVRKVREADHAYRVVGAAGIMPRMHVQTRYTREEIGCRRNHGRSVQRERGRMSAPENRLLSDRAAERLEIEARVALACAPLLPAVTETLASAVVALVEDRRARQERGS